MQLLWRTGKFHLWIMIQDVVSANIAKEADFFVCILVKLILKCKPVEVVDPTFPDVVMPFDFLDGE